ncbi:MAG: redox-regulated ATPase YchF, partial [Bartonella sp.]|nr:redox-regulated ATPase YchF [Bartonella sp.]
MGFKCGIIGLPNVGKSTLFNALTKTAAAQAANYPFCTIEPNTGEVAVPDLRMEKIASIAGSKEIIPTRISFVDIAGLVRGASKGEGLGNKFLANIREVDAIIHVLRCFQDENITHVEGRIDPISDATTVETELMLSDLESLERRITQIRKRATGKDKGALAIFPIMEAALKLLQKGHPVRLMLKDISADERYILNGLNLLTSKPVLYVCNVSESEAAHGNDFTQAVEKMATAQNAQTIVIAASIEAEIVQLTDEEALEYLKAFGLSEPGLNRLIRTGYDLLNLITYFTCGPKETRAWTIVSGVKAPQAAGVIHSDFERGFIRAQTISYEDYIAFGGENGAKEAGKARDEGKE